MLQIKSALLAIDTRIQAAVDHIAFFLMRTLGVGKSFIRYACYALMVSNELIKVALPPQFEFSPLDKGLSMATALVFLAHMHITYPDDARADSSDGAASMADHTLLAKTGWKIFGLLMFFAAMSSTVLTFTTARGETLLHDRTSALLEVVFSLNILFLCYLTKTPRKPPPRKERKTAQVEAPLGT